MPYVSRFQVSARNSATVSILNNVRHYLAKRKGASFSEQERQIFLEALAIHANNQGFQICGQHGTDCEELPSLELLDALQASLAEMNLSEDEQEMLFSSLEKLCKAGQLEEESQRSLLLHLIQNAMETVSCLKQQVNVSLQRVRAWS